MMLGVMIDVGSMKRTGLSEGNCRHGIPKNGGDCLKCWDKRIEENRKATKRLLTSMTKAEKESRKSKLQFD